MTPGRCREVYVTCGGGRRYHRPSTNMSRGPKVTGHTQERQGTEGRATKVKGHQSRGEGGARSNAGRIQEDTNNPQNHNHNAAPDRRRQERGQMKSCKKKNNKKQR